MGAQDDVTFKSETKLVEVYATVLDHGSHAVGGLTKDQFQILDDGTPQLIRTFEASDKALSCALLLDSTGSMAAEIPALRNAARMLIEALRPNDRVAVYSFTDHVEELAPMSEDKTAARKALVRLRAGGITALFDAVTHVALEMEKRPGKKVIVLLTDGGDNASVLNRQSAEQRARKVGVPIFAVAQGDALHDSSAGQLLHELAVTTGGHMYKVAQSKDMEKVFGDIASDLEGGYLMTFNPSAHEKLSKWHDLEVVVSNAPKPLKVRARTGYSVE
jgi:Ca-activated chloride channel family protein